jgi:hypothetical protein
MPSGAYPHEALHGQEEWYCGVVEKADATLVALRRMDAQFHLSLLSAPHL